MLISKHISDLLYRYDCVIVPNFGGFIGRKVPSTLNNHSFTPPSKLISFNVNLNQNDGLLINHLSQVLNIPYDQAVTLINETVENWNKDLQKGILTLNGIGSFNQKEEQLIFTPANKVNYLAESFGLSDVDVNYVLRNNIEITPVIEEIVTKKSNSKSIAIAVAASLALLFGSHFYIKARVHKQEIAHQQKISNQIQQASFNILTPLPALTLNVAKQVESVDITENTYYKYHIIAGAFKSEKNASIKIKALNKKGYNANVIGVNKWGLTEVSYASFNNKNKAINMLNKIKRTDNKHAWLLINE